MNNQAPKRRYGIRPNQYEIIDEVVYMQSHNNPSKVIKFDEDRLQKVLKYSWDAHPQMNGKVTACYRYRELETGKWKCISLSKHLGYPRGVFMHKNGDPLDFRSENMVLNHRSLNNKIYKK